MGRRLGKRVGVLAYRRLGRKTAFRHGYNDQEVSAELMMLCKRRHTDTFPLAVGPFSTQPPPGRGRLAVFPRCSLGPYGSRYGRFTASPATDRLEKQPTDLRRHHHYMRDGTRGCFTFMNWCYFLIPDAAGGNVSAYRRLGKQDCFSTRL